MNKTFFCRPLFWLLFLAALSAVSACDWAMTPDDSRHALQITPILRQGDLTVDAEVHSYRGAESMGYREKLVTRWRGQRISNETLSRKLFPPGHRCESDFYEMADARILPDQSLLALFARSNYGSEQCTTRYLVRLHVAGGQWQLERLTIPVESALTPGDAIEEGVKEPWFTPLTPEPDERFAAHEEGIPGYIMRRIAAQAQSGQRWAVVDIKGRHRGYVMPIDLLSLKMYPLLYEHGFAGWAGEASDQPVALLVQSPRSLAEDAKVLWSAIDVRTRKVLDEHSAPLRCYTLVSDEDKAQAQFDQQMYDRDVAIEHRVIQDPMQACANLPPGAACAAPPLLPDISAAQASAIAAISSNPQSGVLRMIERRLTETNDTPVRWDTQRQRLQVAISPLLALKPECAKRKQK